MDGWMRGDFVEAVQAKDPLEPSSGATPDVLRIVAAAGRWPQMTGPVEPVSTAGLRAIPARPGTR